MLRAHARSRSWRQPHGTIKLRGGSPACSSSRPLSSLLLFSSPFAPPLFPHSHYLVTLRLHSPRASDPSSGTPVDSWNGGHVAGGLIKPQPVRRITVKPILILPQICYSNCIFTPESVLTGFIGEVFFPFLLKYCSSSC